MAITMLRGLGQSAAVYDFVQRLAGNRVVQQRLASRMRDLPETATVVDIGGGTGWARDGRSTTNYVCLDPDIGRLHRFRARWPDGMAVAADGTRCPIQTSSLDAVICLKVTHHLDDRQLQAMLAEAARVVKPGGVLVLADALLSRRLLPRLLWRLDRGAYPRTAEAIKAAIPRTCVISDVERFRAAMFHDFLLIVARRIHEPEDAGSLF